MPAPAASAVLPRHLTLRSATLLVLANIIGAGIFTTTGYQAAALGHPGWILGLWAVGGALAFCGALCYGELGAALPRAGAEYAYLRGGAMPGERIILTAIESPVNGMKVRTSDEPGEDKTERLASDDVSN